MYLETYKRAVLFFQYQRTFGNFANSWKIWFHLDSVISNFANSLKISKKFHKMEFLTTFLLTGRKCLFWEPFDCMKHRKIYFSGKIWTLNFDLQFKDTR